MFAREGSDLTLVAAGDAIITRRLSATSDERLEPVLEPIRAADASVVNLEVLLHDYEGYPAAQSGGTYMRAPPYVADELTWAGFDVFAAATNHVGDYSHGGMEATMRELEARTIPYAGLGRTLANAREPAYVDTPGGRVALVAACSSITTGSVAGEQRPDVSGRPGLAPLRLEATYRVPSDDLAALRSISENLGLEAFKDRREELGFRVPGGDTDGFTLLNVGGDTHLTIESADSGGDAEYAVERRVSDEDLTAFTRQIDTAARQADWVVASLHAHEGAGPGWNDRSVPNFLEEVAHAVVDAGADAFVGHGPHLLRGIEVYDGAPLFYSLGNFVMQNETVSRLPAEIYDRFGIEDGDPADLFDERVFDENGERIGFLADRGFWESVVPACEFVDGSLAEIVLYPIELGFETPRPQRGRPLLAGEEDARRIIADLDELSDPFGTEIAFDDERGVGVLPV